MTPNVLIVDDSLTIRMNLADAFTAAGFHALPCGSAQQARDLLAAEPVDVMILDVILPDVDGVELLRELRSNDAKKHIPVLMLSSEAEVHDRIRGLRTGADDYVGKPYDVGYVIARARELVNARSSTLSTRPVLLIDDSQTFRMALRDALELSGYSVVTAESGEEGLRLAATQHPAAVVVDGVLPGIDGATVIRHLRLDAALRGVPCILLTASKQAGDELRALDSGADVFVRKDEDTAVILAKLSALLRVSHARADAPDAISLLAPKKVLAVDDSQTYREALASQLRKEGYEVILARSGEEAIELLAVQHVDCILLDLMMEGIGGAETCNRLKSSPGLRDVPVIVLTAIEDRESMLTSLALGADDYIPKSAEAAVLMARVRAQLRRRQFEDETRNIRERLLRSELEAATAQSARDLAAARAKLVEALESKNQELQSAYDQLQAAQAKLVQSAKMASLGELVAGVAHEINNPLAFTISHLGTAQRSLDCVRESIELPEGRAREQWERASSRLREMGPGLERIRELVVKLRTFSRLDEGERNVVSVRECVDSLLTILGHRIKDRIQLETHFGDPDVLDCFPGILTQAIMNLVSNAIDAIDGSGTIRIAAGPVTDGYEISVTDTGCGIAHEHRDRVLEPFFTTKPVGQGTGLGLSITYSIVRKHGGTLELRDAAGGGTQALIRLPHGGLVEG